MIAVSALRIAEFLLCYNTDHGCFSSETVIITEIHAMCIKYQTFWKIYLNRWIDLEFLWSLLKVIWTSTRERLAFHEERETAPTKFISKKSSCLTCLALLGTRFETICVNSFLSTNPFSSFDNVMIMPLTLFM